MGKTESGTVWLSAERTSPYEFFQYWVRIADEDAGKCLRVLTELSRQEVEALDEQRRVAPHERASQLRLAEELTRLVHGESGLAIARRATEMLHGAPIDSLTDAQAQQIFRDVPGAEFPLSRLSPPGLPLIDALIAVGLAQSKGEARRTISQGGAYINNFREASIERHLTAQDLVGESTIVLRTGKKKYGLLRFNRAGR
jgi:tyrosyl-tRNA synthetase